MPIAARVPSGSEDKVEMLATMRRSFTPPAALTMGTGSLCPAIVDSRD
jgi:hypothetical protein